ncbi:hypothetical protein KM043_007610 [Ampulex compressa]|nr:hypothetical protein KM043_007610 [Ampulex compressa]
MSLPLDSLIYELSQIPSVKKMTATIDYSARSGVGVGLATFASGALGGPLGLAVGGIVSSFVAYAMTKDTFRSVPDILINECTYEEKIKLYEILKTHLTSEHINSIRSFVNKLQTDMDFTETIVQLVVVFLQSVMHKKVISN